MLESLDLFTTPLPWALGFLALMVIELSTTGFVAGFMAFGSLLTAIAVQVGLAPTPSSSVLSFLTFTVVSSFLLWKPITRWAGARRTTDAQEGIEPFVGDMATVESDALTVDSGQIRLHGARMSAVLALESGSMPLRSGQKVRIVSRDVDQRFVVEPITSANQEQAAAAAEIAAIEFEARRARQLTLP